MRFSDSPAIDLPVGKAIISLQQDNGSVHVGTSVWPSSLVLVKFLDRWLSATDKNPKNPQPLLLLRNLDGKRAIELGAGCGPAGMGLALLLPFLRDFILTDIAPVLPALRRNLKRNRHLFPNRKPPRHSQLYWQNPHQIRSLRPPFHLVVAADVVYLEDSVLHLVSAMDSLLADDGFVLLGYQRRSPEVHTLFWERCVCLFDVLMVPKEDLDPDYAYDDTDIFLLTRKKENKLEEDGEIVVESNHCCSDDQKGND